MATKVKPTKPTTTLDFSKVFSTNAPSTPFTWTDSDYLEGWDSIQNTPPSRQQFNALQEHSDKKENFLYKQYLEGYVDKFLDYLDTVKAPINSPTFTGDPKAPTPSWSDNDTSLATTAFVQHWVKTLRDEGGLKDWSYNPWYWTVGDNIYLWQWGTAITDSNGLAIVQFPLNFDISNFGYAHMCYVDTTDLKTYSFAAGAWQSPYMQSDSLYVAVRSGDDGTPAVGVIVGVLAIGKPA